MRKNSCPNLTSKSLDPVEAWGLLFYIILRTFFSWYYGGVYTMNIEKIKKIYCNFIGADSFKQAIIATIVGLAMYVFFMWIMCDWINIVVTRGY